MTATERQHKIETEGRLGLEVYNRVVKPLLKPEDDGKFVAVDIDTGNYEVDENDIAVVNRLKAGNKGMRTMLFRAGRDSTYKFTRHWG